MEWRISVFVILSFVALVLFLYLLFYYSFDNNLQRDNDKMAEKLRNGPLAKLLNGSDINNIPLLNLITTNVEVARANKCARGPVFISPNIDATDDDCRKTCVNESAKVIRVDDNDTFYHSTILKRGAHCVIGPRPECNTKMTRAMMTINSVTCRSKFPKLVGGPLGTRTVACNDNIIYDPKNILWDYKENEQFNPDRTKLVDEDEILPDGNYRFRCKFEGKDVRNNQYMAHPYSRLHPFRNYCASEIYGASPEVQTIFSEDKSSFVCDCGNKESTRVKNIYPDDPTSKCAHVSFAIKDLVKSKKEMTIPYRCFTKYSFIGDLADYLPCPPDQFNRTDGSTIAFTKFEFTTNPRALIEHPLYESWNETGVVTFTSD